MLMHFQTPKPKRFRNHSGILQQLCFFGIISEKGRKQTGKKRFPRQKFDEGLRFQSPFRPVQRSLPGPVQRSLTGPRSLVHPVQVPNPCLPVGSAGSSPDIRRTSGTGRQEFETRAENRERIHIPRDV